jgi:hypothetical protein
VTTVLKIVTKGGWAIGNDQKLRDVICGNIPLLFGISVVRKLLFKFKL